MYFKQFHIKKLRILRWKNMLRCKSPMSLRKYEALMWRLDREAKKFKDEELPALLRQQV